MRNVVKVLAIGLVLLFLYSCGIFTGPSTEIILKDEAGNTYAMPVKIDGRLYKPNEDGKILVDLEDGTYDLELVGVKVFKLDYTVVIKNGVGEVVLEKSSEPAADILIKNGKRTLIVANLGGYKGIELNMEYAGSVSPDMRDFDYYIGVYSSRLAFFGAKKGGHLSNWMELPAPSAWKDVKAVFGYTDSEKIPIEVK